MFSLFVNITHSCVEISRGLDILTTKKCKYEYDSLTFWYKANSDKFH